MTTCVKSFEVAGVVVAMHPVAVGVLIVGGVSRG